MACYRSGYRQVNMLNMALKYIWISEFSRSQFFVSIVTKKIKDIDTYSQKYFPTLQKNV